MPKFSQITPVMEVTVNEVRDSNQVHFEQTKVNDESTKWRVMREDLRFHVWVPDLRYYSKGAKFRVYLEQID